MIRLGQTVCASLFLCEVHNVWFKVPKQTIPLTLYVRWHENTHTHKISMTIKIQVNFDVHYLQNVQENQDISPWCSMLIKFSWRFCSSHTTEMFTIQEFFGFDFTFYSVFVSFSCIIFLFFFYWFFTLYSDSEMSCACLFLTLNRHVGMHANFFMNMFFCVCMCVFIPACISILYTHVGTFNFFYIQGTSITLPESHQFTSWQKDHLQHCENR